MIVFQDVKSVIYGQGGLEMEEERGLIMRIVILHIYLVPPMGRQHFTCNQRSL